MTIFGLYLKLCGLSHKAAASPAHLDMSYDTLRSGVQGKFRINDGVMAELAALRERIETEADAALDRLERTAPPYEIEVAGDDHAALAMGWPSAGPQEAMALIVVASLPLDQVRVVTLYGLELERRVEECRALTAPGDLRAARMRERRKDPALNAAIRAGIDRARTEKA